MELYKQGKTISYIYINANIYMDRKYNKYKNIKIAVFNRDIEND